MGKFITIDGPNGVGKTTLVFNLANRLQESGHSVITVREPGGTELGEIMREWVKPGLAEPLSQAFMCATSRVEAIAKIIRPALAEGKWVISDRSVASTWVYQYYLGGVDRMAIERINLDSMLGLEVDYSVILNVGLDALRERIADDNRGYRGMSRRDMDRVYAGYINWRGDKSMLIKSEQRFLSCDDPMDVCERVLQYVTGLK